MLSLKPTVGDFIVLVFCESVSGLPLLGSIGKNKRLMLWGISSFRSELLLSGKLQNCRRIQPEAL